MQLGQCSTRPCDLLRPYNNLVWLSFKATCSASILKWWYAMLLFSSFKFKIIRCEPSFFPGLVKTDDICWPGWRGGWVWGAGQRGMTIFAWSLSTSLSVIDTSDSYRFGWAHVGKGSSDSANSSSTPLTMCKISWSDVSSFHAGRKFFFSTFPLRTWQTQILVVCNNGTML